MRMPVPVAHRLFPRQIPLHLEDLRSEGRVQRKNEVVPSIGAAKKTRLALRTSSSLGSGV